MRSRNEIAGTGEALAVWAVFAAVGIAVFVTYARLPAQELYHVSGSGIEGGASRALVFTNFPTALVAIAMLAIVVDRRRERLIAAAAVVALVLCAFVFAPGVVDEANLDAKPINAAAAVGVVTALALVLRAGSPGWRPWLPGDPLRIGVAAALLVLAVPWIAADLGFSLDHVPVLGTLWQTGELRREPGVPGLHPAVHHGHHHGLDGTILAVSALALSRVRVERLAGPLAAYLALMLAYGVANAAQDAWLEQVVKRGWTEWQLPSVLRPELTWGWLAILVGAVVVRLVAFRPARR